MRPMSRLAAILAAIPERTTRMPSGTPIRLPRDANGQESRLAFLSQHLSWLTPFSELGPEGQRALGLLAARDKAMDRDEDEADDELLRR
jgi:hypothetical protein